MIHTHKTLLAAALWAMLPASAFAAETATIDAAAMQSLLQRLERLEARLGDGTPPAPSADADTIAALTQRLAILERKLELADEAAGAKAPTTPVVSVDEKGASVKSADGAFEVTLKGNVQVDQRAFFGGDAPANETFLLRRVEPIIEGSPGPLAGFRPKADFAGDGPTSAEACADLRFDPAYTLRVGKFKCPVGLERLQSSSSLPMIERSFPTELAPNQHIGAQLQGELAGGTFSHALGVFNGAPDGRDLPTTDADDNVEFAGRMFFEPGALRGFAFGPGASVGGKLDIDDDAFPDFADPGLAPPLARSRATSLSRYLHPNFKVVFNHVRTDFDGGAAAGADRPDEEIFSPRVQVASWTPFLEQA